MDDDAVSVYKREIAFPRLTEEEEKSLVSRLSAEPEQRERILTRLIQGHLITVVRIAEEYPGSNSRVLDLIVAGNEALLKAVQTYAPGGEEGLMDRVTRTVRAAMELLSQKPDPYAHVVRHSNRVQ